MLEEVTERLEKIHKLKSLRRKQNEFARLYEDLDSIVKDEDEVKSLREEVSKEYFEIKDKRFDRFLRLSKCLVVGGVLFLGYLIYSTISIGREVYRLKKEEYLLKNHKKEFKIKVIQGLKNEYKEHIDRYGFFPNSKFKIINPPLVEIKIMNYRQLLDEDIKKAKELKLFFTRYKKLYQSLVRLEKEFDKTKKIVKTAIAFDKIIVDYRTLRKETSTYYVQKKDNLGESVTTIIQMVGKFPDSIKFNKLEKPIKEGEDYHRIGFVKLFNDVVTYSVSDHRESFNLVNHEFAHVICNPKESIFFNPELIHLCNLFDKKTFVIKENANIDIKSPLKSRLELIQKKESTFLSEIGAFNFQLIAPFYLEDEKKREIFVNDNYRNIVKRTKKYFEDNNFTAHQWAMTYAYAAVLRYGYKSFNMISCGKLDYKVIEKDVEDMRKIHKTYEKQFYKNKIQLYSLKISQGIRILDLKLRLGN